MQCYLSTWPAEPHEWKQAYDRPLFEADELCSYVVSCAMDRDSPRKLVSLNNKCMNLVVAGLKNRMCDSLLRLGSTLKELASLSKYYV